jgi:hypothetical protein
MPSAQLWPSGQPLAVSQPFGMRNGVVHAGPNSTACRRLSLQLFFFKKTFINVRIFFY